MREETLTSVEITTYARDLDNSKVLLSKLGLVVLAPGLFSAIAEGLKDVNIDDVALFADGIDISVHFVTLEEAHAFAARLKAEGEAQNATTETYYDALPDADTPI